MSNNKIRPLQLEVVTSYLEPILVQQGFVFYRHEYYDQSFGTGLCIYGRAQESIRILWDGKDYWLILQYSKTDLDLNDWRDIKWHDITVERIGRNPVSNEHLERLKETMLNAIELQIIACWTMVEIVLISGSIYLCYNRPAQN